ncbi:hypothetical protein [Dyadobacter sediminis]|uniref:Uncharacterized protein n=1 Tax=Dyadobacter sediminis TaxID=1493691 RepID=A0A5R9K655_9BACT|nr:hypothetical protein [Dyadobacter sediminis]TLU89124.1 hypothetical protein FEM55_23845 [Dyadobacter sediminis]GGC02627.1 hypothetical protein GCM10011325_32110 [Dyadobacter sediminis]
MSKYFSISLTLAIILVFGFTLFNNVLNAPTFDDYNTTLDFIRRFYFENNSFGGKVSELFNRHNEHRILISKAAAAVYYRLFHYINFAHLILFQNLFFAGFFILVLALMKQQKQLVSETVLFITAFLASLSFWQVTFYYWGGIQHYTVFFFSFLSLFLLNKTPERPDGNFLASVLAALLAVLSFGNGFIVLFLGAFLLFAQKKRFLLFIWGTISLVLLFITFLPRPEIGATAHAAFDFGWMARLLFTFLGSFIYVNPPAGVHINIILCMITGLAVAVCWLWLFLKGYAFRNPLLYCLLSFPVLTGIIISISRFETKAAGGIAPRYMFFTAAIPVFLLLIFMDMKIITKSHLKFIAAFGVVIWGISFHNNLSALKDMNKEQVATIMKWKTDPATPLIYYREAKTYSDIMSWALAHRVVKLPAPENYPIDKSW